MGKHKHEKHKHHRPSREYEEAPLNPVPKLIVKIGSDMTPERVDSPAAPVLYPSDNQFHHHHRHKEKKKKKKKDKKKSHDKDKEHRHRKKRKREYSSLEPDPNLVPVKVPRLETEMKEEPGVLAPKVESPPPPSRICVPDVKQKSTFTKVLEHLLIMLEKKDVSNFFTHPVSDAMAPGYSQIIKEPMDFSTMKLKIAEGAYESLAPFRRDFGLICNNCMLYNTPDTIYHKASKRLLQLGSRVLLPDRLRALAEHIPIILELTPQQLGFSIKDEVPAEMTVEEEKDISRVLEEIRGGVRRPPGRFQAIPDNIPPQDISNQVKAAAASAAARLSLRKPGSQMGFLRQKQDGTTSLAFVTPVDGAAGERAVTLGQLIGRVKNGASALQGFKEDRRNGAKAFNPIYYGAFSSYGPAYDSTFANLTKQETELVYSTYGDDVGVAYAESIKNFSKNCEYATFIVDHLLDILTGNEHKKTSKYVEEQKCLRAEESAVKAAFEGEAKAALDGEVKVEAAGSVDFASLKSLADDGIDMSFLDSLQSLYADIQASPASKLESNAALIETLRDAQHDRLSGPPPLHLGQVSGPSNEECEIADRVQANLVSMVGKSRPKDIFVQNGRS